MTWLPVTVTAEPASEPVSLEEAKLQCRVDGSDEDALLNGYIAAARQLVEQYTGTKLVEQTVLIQASHFECLCRLPIAPLSEVTEIKYLDTDGVEQTLSEDVYESVLVGLCPLVRLKINQSWPTVRPVADAVRVTATAGYEAVPEPIKQAMLLTISRWYDDRSTGELPEGAHHLLANYRRF